MAEIHVGMLELPRPQMLQVDPRRKRKISVSKVVPCIHPLCHKIRKHGDLAPAQLIPGVNGRQKIPVHVVGGDLPRLCVKSRSAAVH